MPHDAAKAAVRAYLEAWSTPDDALRAARFAAVLAPDFWDEMPDGRRTRDDVVREAATYRDIAFTVHQLVAEGEWVACRATCHFTDEATGRRVAMANPFFARVVDGRLVEGYGFADQLGVLKQTGRYRPPEG